MPTDEAEKRLIQLQRTLPKAGSVGSYMAGVAVVAVALLLKVLLDLWAGEPVPPYITFYPAVVIAALIGGYKVGLAVAVGTVLLAWYFWIPPLNSIEVVDARGRLVVGTYIVTSTLLALAVGFARYSMDRAAASEAERANAARESVHRIKNLIAVVQAISAKVAAESGSIAQYKEILNERLLALNSAQNVLVQRRWQDVPLSEIVRTALAPFLPNPGLSVRPGPDVMVPARHVGGLSMALYELGTNAMKYGALAGGRGPVVLSWRIAADMCTLEWQETLSQAAKVERSGFGTTLIKIALSREPKTEVAYEVTPSRVMAVFRWPAAVAA